MHFILKKKDPDNYQQINRWKNSKLMHTTTWINYKFNVLNERSQAKKNKSTYWVLMISLT